MALRITKTEMTSDVTRQAARWSPDAAADGAGAWLVTWVPARLLTQNQAVTAMTIAEVVAEDAAETEFADWRLHVDGWAAELGLTGPWAIQRAHAAELAALAELGELTPAAAAADPSAPAVVKFTVTTTEVGRQTKVMISAHDTMFDAPPFEVASFTVRVCGRRPRRDAMRYLTEIIVELGRELAARPPGRPDMAELERLLTPLPFGADYPVGGE
jgi:hypothetical protein